MKGPYLITGGLGQVGRALLELCQGRGIEAEGFDLPELDVTDEAAMTALLLEKRPSWVFHCAAATKVDTCETEHAWADRVNGEAPGIVARACKKVGAGLVHYSTDFVFDGKKGSPYVEADPVHPLSVYGSSKRLGEERVFEAGLESWFILRTQWVYGPLGRNFPAAILARAEKGEPLRVVDDQVGAPTYSYDLAEASLDLVERHEEEGDATASVAASGLYHAANGGHMSWYDFAGLILAKAGHSEIEIERISSGELDLPAERPAYSVLDTSKLRTAIGRDLPGIDAGLDRYFAAQKNQDK